MLKPTPTDDLPTRLAAAAGMLAGCGWKDASAAVFEALELLNRSRHATFQQLFKRVVAVDMSRVASAGDAEGVAGALHDALQTAYLNGVESQCRHATQEAALNDQRLTHIEENWFDSYPGNPRLGEPPHFQWAFSSLWEYSGTTSLREAIDREIALKAENPPDDDPVGEPVVTAADLALVAHVPADEVLPDSEGGEI